MMYNIQKYAFYLGGKNNMFIKIKEYMRWHRPYIANIPALYLTN